MKKILNPIVLIVALTIGALPMFATETSEADAAAAPSAKGVVNINTADASQIALLPKLGPKAGERVVAFRKENGPFKKTTDLMQVKGIGDKTFEVISAYLTVKGDTTLTEEIRAPRKPRASRKAASSGQPSTQAQQ